jgi:hypothetical protein
MSRESLGETGTQETRDHRVYYVRCPEEPYHFILKDPADPMWEKTPPKSPCKTICYLCGERYIVKVIRPWRIGYVSSQELYQLWTLKGPEKDSSVLGNGACQAEDPD